MLLIWRWSRRIVIFQIHVQVVQKGKMNTMNYDWWRHRLYCHLDVFRIDIKDNTILIQRNVHINTTSTFIYDLWYNGHDNRNDWKYNGDDDSNVWLKKMGYVIFPGRTIRGSSPCRESPTRRKQGLDTNSGLNDCVHW